MPIQIPLDIPDVQIEKLDTSSTKGFVLTLTSTLKGLKGRGFHLEETRLTRYFRIKKVMALVAVAFCWAHKTGEWKHQAVRPLKTKNHGRPEQSLFRYGLDYLTDSLLHGLQKIEDRFRLWVLFLCPPDMIGVDPQKPGIMVLKI